MKTKLFLALCAITLNFELKTLTCFSQATRLWGTYYGGAGDSDESWSITTDTEGNVYLAGSTNSNSGIASGGHQNIYGGVLDAFIAKFDAAGNRLWATYYGGTRAEFGYSVAIDAFGNVYLAGNTDSNSSIASGGFQNIFGASTFTYNAFLVKFDAVTGSRIWATYYGGMNGEDGNAVATDASGNVYLVGSTQGSTGLASSGFQNAYGGGSRDAFLVKFDGAGNRLWATYYGDTGDDQGWSVTTDAQGNVYMAGLTASVNNVASGGFQNAFSGGVNSDAFLVKFDPSGNRLWATYYGEVGVDIGNCVTTDASGNVYLAGSTSSNSNIASGGFQNANGGGVDAFLVKFNSGGNRLWATYYGGIGIEETPNIAIDAAGNLYLEGDTYSPNNIDLAGFQNSLSGSENEFLVKFDPSGNRLCATYYGQQHDENGHIAIDVFGNIYVAGKTESTSGIASTGFQNTFGGGTADAYLVKFSSCGPLTAGIIPTNILCNGACAGIGIAAPSGGSSPYSYLWGDGQTTKIITGLCTGTYTVIVTDFFGASVTTTVSITQHAALSATITGINPLCNGGVGSATVSITGGISPYITIWSNGQTITTTSLIIGTHTVIITDNNGCFASETVTISQPAALSYTLTSTSVTCNGYADGTITISVGGGMGPYTPIWSNGVTTSPIIGPTICGPFSPGSVTVTITDVNGCVASSSVTINQPTLLTVSVNATSGCNVNDPFASAIGSGGTFPYSYQWSDGQITPTILNLSSPIYSVTVTDANGCIATNTINVIPSPTITALASAGDVTIFLGDNTLLSAWGGGSYLWIPSAGLSCSTCPNPTANPQSTTEYCVVVTDDNGCSASDCITVIVNTLCEDFFIPTAFSPNKDNSNDAFCLYGTNCIKSMNLEIYSRWGEKVFETTDPKACWDGILKNKKMNDVVFMYYLNVVLNNKEIVTKKGNVTLVK